MILLIDNYDSFSYNLFQLAGQLNSDIKVIRNDALSVAELAALKPSHIILSPGPGRPEYAGITQEVAATIAKDIPTLGVCLGHQAICAAYGATITYASKLMHGKQSITTYDLTCPLFKDVTQGSMVARYHSLAADPATIPDCLKVVASTDDGEIMAVAHKDYQIYGLQFHPESFMTTDGHIMLKNFLSIS